MLAIAMPVLPPTQVVTEKLTVAQRASLRFRGPAPRRARRPRAGELGPWSVRDTADNEFAAAFLFLTDRLGITA